MKENSRQNLLLRTNILQKTADFLVHFLAVELHDCNVKRPENFLVFTFYGGNVVHVLVHFFHCRSFFLAGYKIRICSVLLGQIGPF